MRRHVLMVVAAVLLIGADDRGDAAKADRDRLQGTWRYVSFTANGEKMPQEQLDRMTVTYDGDRWTVKDGDKMVVAGTQKLDPTKKPAQMDSEVTEGEGKGATMLGIYELKGDTLRVCFDPQGKDRPTSLTPKEGQFGGVSRKVKK